MNRTLKTMALGLLGALSLTTAQVSAASCGDCCWDPCDLGGCFEVGGEALWMKPTGADFQYASSQTTVDTTTNFELARAVGDYDWGFRLFGSYFSDDCCNFMTLDWTYLRTRDANSVERDGISMFMSIVSDVTRAEGRIRFDYDKVNLRFGRYLCSGCDSRLYAYVGGRYVDIKERRSWNANFTFGEGSEPGVATYNESSDFQAGGMEVGFGGDYDLWCDFSLVANIGFTAQVGEVKNNAQVFVPGASVDATTTYNIKSRTICVPGSEFRLGLEYTYKCDCWWITGELGYQMDYYWRALSLRDAEVSGQSHSVRTNVGFAGLYFGLKARF